MSGLYGKSDMTGNTLPNPGWSNTTTTDRGGQNVSSGPSPGQYNNQDFWQTTLGWDFVNIWQMSDGGNSLPVLQN
jgi:hypothetical protein